VSAPLPEPAPPPAAPEPGPEMKRVVTKWLDMPYVEVEAHERMLRFAATGPSSLKRVRTIFTKEPTTLAWIDAFDEGETVFDIGANVGTYTIYAAVTKGAKVVAFEPEALNFAEVNKNIFLNDLHDSCIAYCVALSDVDKTDRLLLSDFGVGISYHDFEEDSWKGDQAFSPDWIVKKEGRRQQGAVGRRIDSLIADGLPMPDHIKIDVDGLEHRVIAGMIETLKDPRLKTVLIEVNFEDERNLAIIDLMQSLGWRYSFDQISCNRAIIFSAKQIERYKNEKRGGLNYIFYKDEKWDAYFADFAKQFVPGDLSTYSAS
jgi:FkbM family methyltransferase